MLPLCCVPRSKHFGIVPAKLLHAFLVLSSNRQFLRAKGPTVCMNHKRCNYMQISNTHNHLQIINVPADSVGQKSHSPWSAARAWRMAYIFGRLHFLVLQRTGDIESIDQTNLAEDGRGRSAPSQFWPGDSKAVCNGQIGMATTCRDGYVYLTHSLSLTWLFCKSGPILSVVSLLLFCGIQAQFVAVHDGLLLLL